MQYATGRYMAHRCMHEDYSVFDVLRMVQSVYEGRVRFHDGDAQLAPVLRRYPAARPELAGAVAALDEQPASSV